MEFNLRGIDLNLLPVFEAAYEERSLSRAAERLAMTQPAVSHALARLRVVFKDDLFIRHTRGMTPTATADAIYAKLRGALDSVREAVNEVRGFDPAISARRFFVTIPHPLGPTIAFRLIEIFAKLAPNVTVEFSTRSRPVDLERDLREGRVDLAIDWLAPRDENFHSETIFEDRPVAMARSGHPVFKQEVSAENLKAYSFVTLRPRSDLDQQPEGLQQWRSLKLNVALEVSELLEILLLISQSDLLGLMPLSFEKIANETFDVQVLNVPSLTEEVPIRLIWHPRRQDDPAHIFLRQQISAVVREVVKMQELD
jgi:LysR family transcriptional regulator, transcriptional activator for leuABCD operon